MPVLEDMRDILVAAYRGSSREVVRAERLAAHEAASTEDQQAATPPAESVAAG
jgi:acetaldehyde dehydrogenase/alcohol dehydrogenase